MNWSVSSVVFLIIWFSAIASAPQALQFTASIVAAIPCALGSLALGIMLRHKREPEITALYFVCSLFVAAFCGITGIIPILVSVGVLIFSTGIAVAFLPRKSQTVFATAGIAKCPHCDYPTYGLSGPVCPECGNRLPTRL